MKYNLVIMFIDVGLFAGLHVKIRWKKFEQMKNSQLEKWTSENKARSFKKIRN